MSAVERFDPDTALARMRERSGQARESAAAVMFEWAAINAALSAAATKGQTAAFIQPEIPMDVSETETAKVFVALLHKAGFVAEWKARQQPDGETTKVLRVSWGVDATR